MTRNSRFVGFIEAYNRCYSAGATSLNAVAEMLGWPISRVYKTLYFVRQMERETAKRVLAGRISRRSRIKEEFENAEESSIGTEKQGH